MVGRWSISGPSVGGRSVGSRSVDVRSVGVGLVISVGGDTMDHILGFVFSVLQFTVSS